MMGNRKESKVLHINHAGELLIWLIIVLIFIAFSSVGKIIKEKNDENDYQIFLQDVDGLIVGSPVRMMGIEVGYITKIKPTKDEVYVKFILTNPDVYIPQGTQATVEFSGMAGSKSLELYLPDEKTYVDKNSAILSVNPPKRLHDALGLLNDMFKKLASITYTASSFGNKLEETGVKKAGAKTSTSDMSNFINYSDKFLKDSNIKATELRDSIKRFQNDK